MPAAGPGGRLVVVAPFRVVEFRCDRVDGLAPSPRTAFWACRLGDMAPIFERAQARRELPEGYDSEVALAMTGDGVY